jgi:N-acetylneuraminate synthase
MGLGVAVAAVALGATVVEKHFTLSRADGGVDATFSLEPEEFARMRVETERVWQALGKVRYGPTEAERPSLVFRRSLYITADLEPGATLTSENVRAIRPGLGLPPKFLEALIGRKVTRAVKRGTPLSWDLLT